MVKETPLDKWKETLGYSISCEADGGQEQALKLGKALLENKDVNAAILCLIIANNFDMVMELWEQRLREELSHIGRKNHPILFSKLFEKIIVLKTICKNYGATSRFDEFTM